MSAASKLSVGPPPPMPTRIVPPLFAAAAAWASSRGERATGSEQRGAACAREQQLLAGEAPGLRERVLRTWSARRSLGSPGVGRRIAAGMRGLPLTAVVRIILISCASVK